MKYTITNSPITCFLSKPNTIKMDIKGIIIHRTFVNNTKLNFYIQPPDNLKNKKDILELLGKNDKWLGPAASNVHARIGYTKDNKICSIQTLPWQNKSNRSGMGTLGSCDNGWIQIEVCSDNLKNNIYFQQMYNELIELISFLCKIFNLNPREKTVILDHAEAFSLGMANNETGISDWLNNFNKNMENIRNDVIKNLGYSDITNIIETKRFQVITDLNIRKEPTIASPVVGKLKTGEIITVNSKKDKWYRLQNNTGWVSSKFLTENIIDITNNKISSAKYSLIGDSDEEKIWNYLFEQINNEFGVAGLMGNMKAESALNSKNLQQSYERKLGFTDDTYTEAVDKGTYKNFIHDKAGYGLVQWTYWSLKEELYNYAKQQKKSIGDLGMQLEFLCKQLQKNYSSVWNALKIATNVSDASNAVLLKFERPADQSINVQKKRTNYGIEYYNKYSKKIKNDVKVEINGTNLGSVLIGHVSIDTKGQSTGGIAGDQTGKDLCIRSWYNKPWIKVFRPITNIVAESLASAMEAACKNDHISYSSSNKTSLFNEAKKVNFDLNKITNDCTSDNVALIAVCANAAGLPVSANMTIGTEEKLLTRTAAFIILTGKEYLNSSQYLKRGDILLANGHTAIVLSNGDKIKNNNVNANNNKLLNEIIGTAIAKEPMNIRTGPGINYKVIGTLAKNTKVNVLNISSSGWLKIIWSKSKSGYAYVSNNNNKYFTYTPSNNSPTIQGVPQTVLFNIKVIADALNVRKEPDIDSIIQAIVKKNSVHTIIETLGNWGHLKSGGWISLIYTERM